jgi:hypothetical protein
MRIAGYLLLGAALVCLFLNTIEARATIRNEVIRQYDRVPDKEPFTRHDALTALRDFAIDLMDRFSLGFAIPAVLVFCVGVCFAIADRRLKIVNAAS